MSVATMIVVGQVAPITQPKAKPPVRFPLPEFPWAALLAHFKAR
jgi:hypothetical protein